MSVKTTDSQHLSVPTDMKYSLFALLLCPSYIFEATCSTASYSAAERKPHCRLVVGGVIAERCKQWPTSTNSRDGVGAVRGLRAQLLCRCMNQPLLPSLISFLLTLSSTLDCPLDLCSVSVVPHFLHLLVVVLTVFHSSFSAISVLLYSSPYWCLLTIEFYGRMQTQTFKQIWKQQLTFISFKLMAGACRLSTHFEHDWLI